jgi:Domain of unknown function (DUF1841)
MTPFAAPGRDSLRRQWRAAWQRYRSGTPLEPLQASLVAVIAAHPEYQACMDSDTASGADAAFLHLGLHLALREQLATDRPSGIRVVQQTLETRGLDAHAAEHRLMEVLANTLWEAQEAGTAPDERRYLRDLQNL